MAVFAFIAHLVMVSCSGSGAWGDPPQPAEEESEVWALAAKLPQKRRRSGGGEDADSDEEDSDELPAYMFRMGLCESSVDIGNVVPSSKCDEHVLRCGVEPFCIASCHKLFREKRDSQLESNGLACGTT